MRKPIYVRPLTAPEQRTLQKGLRASDAFCGRRCQILLASARGQHARLIAEALGCDDQTVRNVIRAFNARGLRALQRGSSAPHRRPHAIFDAARRERLRALLHQSPRTFGQSTSVWTLALAAAVAYAEGITPRQVSGAAIHMALARLNVRWQRAKHWITSPDPAYARKKKRRDRLIRSVAAHPTWVLGFGDEVWWSRLAQPAMHAWMPDTSAMRLVEKVLPSDDPEPKALACYGLLVRATPTTEEQLWLRFATGQPVSALSLQFLTACCHRLAALGKRALLLVWDNASWHTSQMVRTWLRAHNQQVKRSGEGVRILMCLLPRKSPWLNPIEPTWVHGKRAVVEPARVLTAHELAERVCAYYRCAHEDHLTISAKAA